MKQNQMLYSILGFISANIGIAAIWGSVRVKFWLDPAEIIRFLIVLVLFGMISLVFFKKLLWYDINYASDERISRLNRQLSSFLAVLISISFIGIFLLLNTFGLDILDVTLVSTSVISSLICNIYIYKLSN